MQHKVALFAASVLALSQATAAGSFTDATHASGLGSMAYRVYYPDNYQASGPNKTPVVLYLHSAAERGDSVNDIFSNSYGGSLWTNDWITHLVDETQHGEHQAVLVMPQSGLGEVWNSMTAGDNWSVGSYTNATAKPVSPRLQLAVDILGSVVASNNVNTNKVHVTGPSMGGYGAWDAVARFPEQFAAAAPLAGTATFTAARKWPLGQRGCAGEALSRSPELVWRGRRWSPRTTFHTTGATGDETREADAAAASQGSGDDP